jgi:hypothetical protein
MRWFLVIAVAVAVGLPGGAAAGWSLTGSGSSAAQARTLGPGNVPTVSAGAKKVTVGWAASSYTNGGAPGGYLVKRYDSSTGVVQTIRGGCSGTIAVLTCTENNVPSGSWQYTVTPTTGNWRGPESAKSATVTV